jgi:hypothetical protein
MITTLVRGLEMVSPILILRPSKGPGDGLALLFALRPGNARCPMGHRYFKRFRGMVRMPCKGGFGEK